MFLLNNRDMFVGPETVSIEDSKRFEHRPLICRTAFERTRSTTMKLNALCVMIVFLLS